MLYAIVANGPGSAILHYPLRDADLRAKFPNVSLPENLEASDLTGFNIFQVPEAPIPLPTEIGAWTVVDTPVWNGSALVRTFKSEPCPPDRYAFEWTKVRGRRDALLLQTDWTDLPHAPLTEELAAAYLVYRQALRDVTVQANPFNISWPMKPPASA